MVCVCVMVWALCGSTESLEAQTREETEAPNGPAITGVPSDIAMTPEMWFYIEEYRRYQDPAEAVRRKARQRAEQRRQRLAAQKWFGISNLRPQANPIPWFATYSPVWAGNSWDPYRWTGYGAYPVVVPRVASLGP